MREVSDCALCGLSPAGTDGGMSRFGIGTLMPVGHVQGGIIPVFASLL
jgi:hypothetical protein